MSFFYPRLSTLWSAPLSRLPRWLRANAFADAYGPASIQGPYPAASGFDSQALSYFYGSAQDPSVSGFGPTWGALMGTMIAIAPGLTAPDEVASDSVLARLIASCWKRFNHLSHLLYELHALRLFDPGESLDYEAWRVRGPIPSKIESLEIYWRGEWVSIEKAHTLFELLWRSEPGWAKDKDGLFLLGMEYTQGEAYPNDKFLYLPDLEDYIDHSDVWLEHPRTRLWLKIHSVSLGTSGSLPFYWEDKTALPQLRWKSVFLRAHLASSLVRLNGTDVRALERAPLWNSWDELGILLNTERCSGETNSNYKIRLSRLAGRFPGQSSTKLQLYLGAQFGLLTSLNVSGANATYSGPASSTNAYLYRLLPTTFPRETLTPRNNNQGYLTRYAFPTAEHSTLFTGTRVLYNWSLSGSNIEVLETMAPSSQVEASWALPQWSFTEGASAQFHAAEGFIGEDQEGVFVEKIRVSRSSDQLRTRAALKWRPVDNHLEVPLKGSAVFE